MGGSWYKSAQSTLRLILKLFQNIIALLRLRFIYLTFMPILFANVSAISQVVFQANNTSGCTPMGVVISVTSPSAGAITSYSWQITTPSGTILSATSPQYIAIFSQPGNYDVSLTINGNQTTTVNDYIAVHALPTANFSVNDQSGCFPFCVDFSDISIATDGDIVEWSWDFGDGGSSTEQSPEYCYDEVGNFTPVFSIEDEYGCFADITMPGLIQVVNNFPNASFSASSQLTCNPPVNISFTNNSTGTSALTSTWDYGDGNTDIIAGTSLATHSFANTGTFDVCLTVSDEIGCEDQACIPVTIFETASAQFEVSETTVCEGEIVTFTSTTVPTPTTLAWDFNGDGITDSNNGTASYSYTQAGNYSPTLSVSYGTGCSDVSSGVYNINVIDGIAVDFEADTLQSCSFPFTVNFENLSTGPGVITYEWFVNGNSVGTSADLTYTFNSYDNFDIRLVATNSAGCENQLVLNDYIIVQEPAVLFDNGSSVCTDQNVPVFNVQVTSVDPVAFYFWDFNSDGVTDAEGLVPLFMYDAPGIYQITLTIETITGCTATYTNTQNINVLVQVDATFTSSADTTCAGQPVEFCVDNQPGNTYSWNFYDGSGWIIMPLSENCLIHDYADTGWYDLTLTVFNGACNVLQTFENFIYVQPPVALFEYQVICGNLEAEFADISIGADSIVWDFGDGSPLLSDESNPTHQYDTAGVYTVMLTAYADGSDCPDVTSVELVVSDPDPTMHFTPESGCPPLVSEFTSDYAYPSWDVTVSNGDHITVNWNNNTTEWEIEHSFEGGSESTTSSDPEHFNWPDIIFYEGGYFDVNVMATDENGCTSTIFYDDAIHVSANPDFASFNTTVIDLCNNVNIGFQPDLSELVSWQWVFSDGSVTTSENPFHEFNPPYNYDQPLSATLTATDTLGCVSTVTQDIEVILPAVVDFDAASDPSCIGDAVQFINYSEGPEGTTYSWNFGDPLSSDNTSDLEEPTHIFASNGTYEVCLSADNQAGCITTTCNTDAVHIVNPEVAFTFTSNINNCLYGVQFTNTTPGTSIAAEWNFGDAQSGFGMMSFHTYPIGVYDVTLTITNNFGCVDSLVIPDILNYGNQVGPFTQALDSANCAPFDASLTAFNPNDTYFDYFWDFNDGSGDPSGNTITTHTYLNPGTYCPSVIMTDPNGCPVLISCTDSIVVEEFVMAYSVPDYICFGDTLHLTVENATTYQWQNTTYISQGSSTNEFLLYPDDDHVFLLHGTYADCERTDSILVVVYDLPSVDLTIPSSVCFGEPEINLDMGTPSVPAGTYFVDGNEEIVFSTTQPTDHNYEIVYQYTDTFQCTNFDTAHVFLHALPIVDMPALSPLCENADTLVLNMASPNGGYYTHELDTISYFDPSAGYGNYMIGYFYTDIYGCTSSDSSDLRINPLPIAAIEFNYTCLNEGLDINNLTTIPEGNISETNWNFGVAGSDNNFNPGPVLFPQIGNYNFSVSMISDAGCIADIDSTVEVHAVPIPLFTPQIACQHTLQAFQDLSTIAADSMVTWLWSTEGQTIDTTGGFEYSFEGYGEIPVTLTVISNFGCRDSVTNNIQVRPAPVVDISHSVGCFDVESEFHADVTIPYGGVVSNEWQFGDGSPGESGVDADNLYAQLGTYEIIFTAISNMGCITEVRDSLTIYPLPQPDFVCDPEQMCAGVPFQIIDLSSVDVPSNLSQWQWYLDGEFISGEQNPTYLINSAGSFDIQLVLTTDHGCTLDTTVSNAVTMYPAPVAGFSNNNEASTDEPIVEITNTSSEDVTSWYYDFGDGSSDTFENGSHFYNEHGEYVITQYVRNTFGCVDTANTSVVINPTMLVFVPNTFTPDVNGHNEIFIPVITGFDITYYELKIYDRWGIEVFSTTDTTQGWDGTFNGGMSQDGLYSWVMDIRNGTDVLIKRKFGEVFLLR